MARSMAACSTVLCFTEPRSSPSSLDDAAPVTAASSDFCVPGSVWGPIVLYLTENLPPGGLSRGYINRLSIGIIFSMCPLRARSQAATPTRTLQVSAQASTSTTLK